MGLRRLISRAKLALFPANPFTHPAVVAKRARRARQDTAQFMHSAELREQAKRNVRAGLFRRVKR